MWSWLQKLMSFFQGEEEQRIEDDVRSPAAPAPGKLQAKTKSIYPKERASNRTADEIRADRERYFRFPVVPDEYPENKRKDKQTDSAMQAWEPKTPPRDRLPAAVRDEPASAAFRDESVSFRSGADVSQDSSKMEKSRNQELNREKGLERPVRLVEGRKQLPPRGLQPDEPKKTYKPSEIVSPVYGKITPTTREEEHRIHTTSGVIYPRLEQEEHLNQLKQWEQQQKNQASVSRQGLSEQESAAAPVGLPEEAVDLQVEEAGAASHGPDVAQDEAAQTASRELREETSADEFEWSVIGRGQKEAAASAVLPETPTAPADSEPEQAGAALEQTVAEAETSERTATTSTAREVGESEPDAVSVEEGAPGAANPLSSQMPTAFLAVQPEVEEASAPVPLQAEPEVEEPFTAVPLQAEPERQEALTDAPLRAEQDEAIEREENVLDAEKSSLQPAPAAVQVLAGEAGHSAVSGEAAMLPDVSRLLERAEADEPTAAQDVLVRQPLTPAPGVQAKGVELASQSEVEEAAVETALEETAGLAPAYSLPQLDLLDPSPIPSDDDDEHTHLQKLLLEETLTNFNVSAQVVGIVKGPSVTRFELQPAPGVKVNKITGLIDDIKLNLAAKDIRIEAPIPGRNAIGIEVPNLSSRPVMISTIIGSDKFQEHSSVLAVALGMDIGGEPIVADIKKMPHGLIAGATGSGKSVCINSIIVSLLYKATPEQVRLLLIDPKMVELAPYNQLPHLVTPVVTEAKQATAALKWAVEEMEKRYALFVDAGVRDIDRYNQTTDDTLPYIVIVIDELADLMMVSPQDVEDCIIRIAQKARACGIHLLLATQRPSVDVITGNIKANVPTRLAFAVFSQVDSRTILDQSGAERLLGRGDMLFLESGTTPVRLQGNFVSDDEIERITQVIKKQRKPSYLFSKEDLEQQAQSFDSGEDPLYLEALVFVAEQGQASASGLQRRFRVGYNRAARLIEMMEADGYVAGQSGGKARAVLISREDAQAVAEGSTLI